jgi:hypothetical protein
MFTLSANRPVRAFGFVLILAGAEDDTCYLRYREEAAGHEVPFRQQVLRIGEKLQLGDVVLRITSVKDDVGGSRGVGAPGGEAVLEEYSGE